MALLAGLGIVAFQPVFTTGFILTDDHEVLNFADRNAGDAQLVPLPSLTTRVFAMEPVAGRVRPLYWAVRYAEINLIGAKAFVWHALFLGMGVVSAVVLFGALRLTGVNRLSAVLAGAWLLVAPGVSSVWMRLGPAESLGVLLLVVAAYSAARGATGTASKAWDVLFSASVVAATLTKEPFALAAPAFVGLRLFLHYRGRGRTALTDSRGRLSTIVPLAAGAAVTLMALKLAMSSTDSYGGQILASAGTSASDATLTNLAILAWLGGVVTPFLVVGAVIEAAQKRRLTSPLREWILGSGLVLLLVIPQLEVYRGNGFGVGRYLLPAGLALTAGIASGNAWLQRQRYFALYLAGLTVAGVSLVAFALTTWRQAELFRVDSSVLAATVDAITSSVRPGATVGIAADPAGTLEFGVSFPYQLTWRGRPDLDKRLLMVLDPHTGHAENVALGNAMAASFFGRAGLAENGCTSVDAVVLFAPEDRVLDLIPCLASPEFHLVTFSESVDMARYLPQFWKKIFPPVTVSYQFLARSSIFV